MSIQRQFGTCSLVVLYLGSFGLIACNGGTFHWCTPLDPILHFQSWCGVAFYGIVNKMWITLLYAVIWTIWYSRNKLVFEQGKPNLEMEKILLKKRWGYWLKGWMDKYNMSPSYLCKDINSLKKWRFIWRSM